MSLLVGLAVGGAVGVFIWVIFPYESINNSTDGKTS